MTAHKCQGSTLDEVIVDFRGKDEKGSGYIEKGSFYVAITRVTEANKLYLRNFVRNQIVIDPRVEYAINTMLMAHRYSMKKVYITEQIFENVDDIKIGYLNINSLLNGHHAEYINVDHNLGGLDVLTIAETHLTSNISTEHIENVLTNWVVKFRFDSPDQKPHMGILTLVPKKPKRNISIHTELSLFKYRDNQCQIQVTKCRINRHSFNFVYCRTTPTNRESEWLMENTTNTEYLLGDLNLDPTVHDQNSKLNTICDKIKKPLLKEITTKNNVQLDHILGIERKGIRIFTTSFFNFISDHKSIVIRISDSGSKFIDDERLPKCYEDDITNEDIENIESDDDIIIEEVEDIQLPKCHEETVNDYTEKDQQSVDDPDTLSMPPPSVPPPRKKRKKNQ